MNKYKWINYIAFAFCSVIGFYWMIKVHNFFHVGIIFSLLDGLAYGWVIGSLFSFKYKVKSVIYDMKIEEIKREIALKEKMVTQAYTSFLKHISAKQKV